MSNKTNSKKVKIFSFKDFISILLIVMFISFTLSGVLGNGDTQDVFEEKTVTTRNLAMFASLAYADLEKIEGFDIIKDTNSKDRPTLNKNISIIEGDLTFKETPMVTDAQLSSIESSTTLLGIPLSDELEDTYSYLFYNLASTDEVADWKIVNYAKFRTTILKGTAEFTAMTFKRGNDIVIAYRGTDFDDIGDWAQDIFYGLVGYAGQERVTQDYAKLVANHYVKQNNDIRIYVTGHSLGGYLTQIGGAALVADENLADNVKEISYFNGMGLKFWSNITSKLSTSNSELAKRNLSKSKINQLKTNSSLLNRTQDTAKEALTSWTNNGGKLISYNINGDIISSLGTHVGKQIGFDAYDICIEHHNGNQDLTNILTSTIFKVIKPFLNKDITSYVEIYKPEELLDFVWITHETDSFFGVLPYEDGTLPASIEVEFDTPSTIKYRKTAKATLTVRTTGGILRSRYNIPEKATLSRMAILGVSDFVVSNKNRFTITSISLPTVTQTDLGYEYKYTLTLKGGILIGKANITLKPDILRVALKNTAEKPLNTDEIFITNNSLVSSDIRTKLR